ncbi:CoA transferase [Lachnospiraceae bacterium NSJ-143]|nr:CoA transferase [Lachnospiraceae bacterium NSJ-143]
MLALDNVKILDLSDGLTCALATKYLVDNGAEVVKIEKISGDKTRSWEPKKNGGSLYFHYLNSGKKSITLDIESEYGKEIFKKLIGVYDVVCTNSEPGYMESIGLGYEELKKIKPELIYASCTYFGDNGPMKYKKASSLVAQARGVAMDMTGVENGYPVKASPSIAEHYTAAYLSTAILLALIDKKIRGIGQKIDISLQDCIFSSIEAAPAAFSVLGHIHTRKGNFDPAAAPYDTYKTSDGYVAIGCSTQDQWEKLCDALHFDDLKFDERFNTGDKRRDNYFSDLQGILSERFITMGKNDVKTKCMESGIPCAAVMNIAEITNLHDISENGFLTASIDKKFGQIRFPALPFKLSNTESAVWNHSPELGENTEEILKEIGINDYIFSCEKEIM